MMFLKQSLSTSEVLKAFMQAGGVGSGHHGHAGIPGHRGGSQPKGGSDVPKNIGRDPDDPIWNMFTDQEWWNMKKAGERHAIEVCNEFGFPIDKLTVKAGPGPVVEINGERFRNIGTFDPTTEAITLYSGSAITKEDIRGVMTHEIHHWMWSRVRDAVRAEQEKWMGEPDAHGVDPVVYHKQHAEKYPIMTLMDPYRSFDDKGKQLIEAEGVSNYSDGYWKKYKEFLSTVTNEGDRLHGEFLYRKAVNETLAEIGQAKVMPGAAFFRCPEIWQQCYDDFQKAHNILKERERAKKG